MFIVVVFSVAVYSYLVWDRFVGVVRDPVFQGDNSSTSINLEPSEIAVVKQGVGQQVLRLL